MTKTKTHKGNKKKNLHVWVRGELFDELQRRIEKRGLSITDAVERGLGLYLNQLRRHDHEHQPNEATP